MAREAAHPRYADLVRLGSDYLAETGRSARGLGYVTADDGRLVPNLLRGQHYPGKLVGFDSRMATHYAKYFAAEQAQQPQY